MPFFLGIDGGGTRTTAWLADECGRVFGRGVAGPSNPLKVGYGACRREILRAAKGAVAAAYDRRIRPALRNGRSYPEVSSRARRPANIIRRYKKAFALDAVVLGLAGTDRPPVHNRLLRWLKKALPARHHLLTSDAAIALQAAIGASPGLIVISGTGSIAFARPDKAHGAGRVLRSGGWGTLFDDAGSGYDLGRKAIAAALRDFDGRGPRTELRGRLCAALRLNEITQVILKPLGPQQIAALLPVVLESGRQRDPVARRLLEDAGRELSELALALLGRLGWTRRALPVVCAGGVFRSSPEVRRSFLRHLRRGAPRARTLLLSRQPVEGALELARSLRRPQARQTPLA